MLQRVEGKEETFSKAVWDTVREKQDLLHKARGELCDTHGAQIRGSPVWLVLTNLSFVGTSETGIKGLKP